jgi:hypothetical protein
MEAFAGASVLALVTVSLAVSLRTLASWRRDGRLPELLLGLMLFLSVGIGYPAMIAATRVQAGGAGLIYIGSSLVVNAGFSLLFLFTLRVFRPRALWARAFAGAGILSLLTNLMLRSFDVLTTGKPPVPADAPVQSLLQITPVVAGYTWTAFESLRYFRMMRLRARLGLGDPIVANRFLLWGITGALVVVGALVNVGAILHGVDVFRNAGILLISSATGLAQAVLLLLAFLPPRAYQEWVRRRAALQEIAV